jgi:hypothetical protein
MATLVKKRNEVHVSMSDCYISSSLWTLESDIEQINGLTIIERSKVMRLDDFRLGKQSTSYRLDKPNSKPFSTIEKLIQHLTNKS